MPYASQFKQRSCIQDFEPDTFAKGAIAYRHYKREQTDFDFMGQRVP